MKVKIPMKQTKWYEEMYNDSLLLGYRGSQAHGTFRPSTEPDSVDDIDIIGVQWGPIECHFGFGRQPGGKVISKRETTERVEGEWDGVFYGVRHFLRLLCKSNPNVLSLLWLADNYYIKKTDIGQRLIDNRDIFSSKEAYRSFTGYAHSQAHKMEHAACQGYMGDKRKKLVEKYGYDTKNASHLIRIQKMGMEFMATGELNVQREDNTYLVDIKRGKFTLQEIKDESARLFKLSEEALVRSPLPPKIDLYKAEALLVGILEDHYQDVMLKG